MFNHNWKEDLKDYKQSKELEAAKKKEKDVEAMVLINQITSTFAKFKLEYECSDLEEALEAFFKVCYGVEYNTAQYSSFKIDGKDVWVNYYIPFGSRECNNEKLLSVDDYYCRWDAKSNNVKSL